MAACGVSFVRRPKLGRSHDITRHTHDTAQQAVRRCSCDRPAHTADSAGDHLRFSWAERIGEAHSAPPWGVRTLEDPLVDAVLGEFLARAVARGAALAQD